MKRVHNFTVLLIVFVAVTYISAALAEKYSDKYDFVDIDAILNNDRTRNQYAKCYTNSGPCITPDAKFFKETFPEAVATSCKKCTDRQKEIFEKIVVYYTEKDPAQWKKLLESALIHARKS